MPIAHYTVTSTYHLMLRFLRHYHRPTIYALSTRAGRAAIGVVRVLGSQAEHVYHQLTRTEKLPVDRKASLRTLYGDRGLLDHALTLFFKGPKTYTGEDLLELHVHGGTAIVKLVMQAVQKLHDPGNNVHIRYAQQGEFSQRAFLNGRFDLTEIEGVREMIDAETESQRLSALASLTGENKRVFQRWRQEIVNNVALLTTVIDFGEEHDLEETEALFGQVEANIDVLIAEIQQYLRKVKGSEVLLKGIKVSLLGPPNAGKLSLLNNLANNDTAIVSDIAGTTRDVIDVPLDIEGYKCVIGDTAGIRMLEEADKIEQEGIKRAKQRSLLGDLALAVIPANEPLTQEFKNHIALLQSAERQIFAVVNKLDLVNESQHESLAAQLSQELNIPRENLFMVSCLTGDGIDVLKLEMVSKFKSISMSEKSDPVIISARAQDLLEHDVLYGLQQFKQWKDGDDVVLAAECLRQSVEGIGKITGDAVGVEEILGVVFSSFCIGK